MNTQLTLFELDNSQNSLTKAVHIGSAKSKRKADKTKKSLRYYHYSYNYEKKLSDTAKHELEKMKQILLDKKGIMKKFYSSFLFVVILLSLVACGNSTNIKNEYTKSLEQLQNIPKNILKQYQPKGEEFTSIKILEANTLPYYKVNDSIIFSGVINNTESLNNSQKLTWPILSSKYTSSLYQKTLKKIKSITKTSNSFKLLDSKHIILYSHKTNVTAFVLINLDKVLNITKASEKTNVTFQGKNLKVVIPKEESKLLLYVLIGSSVIVSIIISQITSSRTKKLSKQALAIVETSEERYRTLVNDVNDITMIVSADGKISFISPSVLKILGYEPTHFVNKSPIDFVVYEDQNNMINSLHAIKTGSNKMSPFEVCILTSTNEKRFFEVVGTNLLNNPAISGIVYNCRDITFQKSSQASIAASRALFEQALTKAPIGIALIDSNYNCFWHNSAILNLLKTTSDKLLQSKLTNYIADENIHIFNTELNNLTGKQLELMFENNLWASVTISCVPANNTSEKYYIVQLSDVTDRHEMQEKLSHQAIHDALTGLPNKLLLYDRLKHALLRNKRYPEGTAVLFCDIDHFKEINDSMGHIVGDELLLIVADRIKNCVRANDTVARFGGDEFVILCENINYEGEVLEIANRLITEVKKPVTLNGLEVFVTASVGIYITKDTKITADEVLSFSDSALYVAKNAGRDQSAIYDDTQEGVVLANLKIGNDLHRALTNNEFELLYQPVVNFSNGNIAGFEALIYWNHPEKGLVSPNSFIHLAEETDLIIPIGDWVLEEAVNTTSNWNKEFETDLSVNINFSYRQLINSSITPTINNILNKNIFEASKLHIEITESSFVKDSEQVRSTINAIKELGCKLAIDDFGTGYSSLNYLKRFAAQIIKIDTSFTQNICISKADSAIVAAIIQLGMALDMDVVAEGIESQEQLQELLSLGCKFGQGFLFSKPVSKSVATNLLSQKFSNWHILENNI